MGECAVYLAPSGLRIMCLRFLLVFILLLQHSGTLLAAAVPLPLPDGHEQDEPSPSITSRHQESGEPKDPADLFRAQLRNPKEMMSILLLIGGDVIQRAVAQLSGPKGRWFTPLVFSFGWVTYAFSTVVSAIGDGTFLPPPDYPGIVVNVKSGDVRTNQSWVLGRLCRDLELEVEAREGPSRINTGLLVQEGYKSCEPCLDWVWWSFVPFLAMQILVAAVPFWRRGNWSILLVTLAGNLLAVVSGSLRAMRQEKYDCLKHSTQSFVLTRGNGHKHVFLLLPDTFAKNDNNEVLANLPAIDRLASASHRAGWRTRAMTVFVAGLWVAFLVVVGGLDADTWYLLTAGLCGMVHNLVCSGWTRTSQAHGIPLEYCQIPGGGPELVFGLNETGGPDGPKGRRGVMDVLVELEAAFPGAGHSLKELFFTGRHTPQDAEKWKGKLKDRTIDERLVREATVDARHKIWRAQCEQLDHVGPLDPAAVPLDMAQTISTAGGGAPEPPGTTAAPTPPGTIPQPVQRRNTAAASARLGA